MDPSGNDINPFQSFVSGSLIPRRNRQRAQSEAAPSSSVPVGPFSPWQGLRSTLLERRRVRDSSQQTPADELASRLSDFSTRLLRAARTPENGPSSSIDPSVLEEVDLGSQRIFTRIRRIQRQLDRPRLRAMDAPHHDDALLRAMYDQSQFQCLLDGDVDVDLAKMEEGGTQYIRDFLGTHDVPKDMAKALNTFLHTFYLGTHFLGEEFRMFAGDPESANSGFERWRYLGRLARVHLWLKMEEIYKPCEDDLAKLIDFALLDSTLYGVFVVKRMKDIKRWFAALREIEVKTIEDAKRVNVGIIGGRYGVQQIWTVAVLYLTDRKELKDKSSPLDGRKDDEVIA